MNPNPTTLSVDEQIDDILYDYWARHRFCKDGCQVEGGNIITENWIKSLIRQVCEEVIGNDEMQGIMTPLQWDIAQDRNYLRSCQRTKLSNLLGEGK